MQYGEPTTSAVVKSGQRAPEALDQASFSSAIAIPAGLRSQTPISQTASKPSAAIASHSAAGHLGETDLRAVAAAQLVEPDPRVDLVDEGVLDQWHRPPSRRHLTGGDGHAPPPVLDGVACGSSLTS